MLTLFEHYVNIIDNRAEKEKYLDEVSNIIMASYGKRGGRPTHDVHDYLADKYFWKLVRKDGKIIAALIYKLDGEYRKYNCGGTDGTAEGKKALYKILEDDIILYDRGAYGEVSNPIEHIYIDNLGGKVIPNKIAQYILKNRFNKQVISLNPDGIHYTRMISGKPIEKVMVGNIPTEYLDLDQDNL